MVVFANRDSNSDVVSEGGMPRFWTSPGSPEELGWTRKTSERPQAKAWFLGQLYGSWQPFQGRNEGCCSEKWFKKEPAGTKETRRT